jgi:predicted dehydrogenase
MKFLIAGLGSIGRRHLRNLAALGERDILLYRTHRSTLPDVELATYPVETDLHAALSHRPDAVIVANPTALHMDIAIPAAQAGCHLFLEKPISHSLERIDELQDAVQQGGGQVFVGFQFRFHPGLQRVRQLLQESAIGRPLSVRAHWGEYLPLWHPWEDYRQGYTARADLGGGVILTLNHPLDYLRWLFGEVSALWAFAGQLSDLELNVEDTAEIGLRFASGVLGSLHLDYNQRPPAHHLEIIGTQGTIRWDNADGAVHMYAERASTALHSVQRASVVKGAWETHSAPEGFERNHLFLAQMRHFIEVVRGQAEPLCTLEDGIQALRLALATHKSQQDGILQHLTSVL